MVEQKQYHLTLTLGTRLSDIEDPGRRMSSRRVPAYIGSIDAISGVMCSIIATHLHTYFIWRRWTVSVVLSVESAGAHLDI